MGEVSCPQCGNPNLDVDAQNNVVYCKNCGFAVRVDPQTGNVTPLSPGGGGGGMGAASPPTGPMPSSHKTVLGMEPFVFMMVGFLFVLLGSILFSAQSTTTIIGLTLVLLLWWFFRR
ncbi:MAG TPA: hypothetical protein VI875_05230 [Candidatus Norongarragalinales archaeon]|nr:hypothetical protein [Candidatus Norongarragalinales archaeon]